MANEPTSRTAVRCAEDLIRTVVVDLKDRSGSNLERRVKDWAEVNGVALPKGSTGPFAQAVALILNDRSVDITRNLV